MRRAILAAIVLAAVVAAFLLLRAGPVGDVGGTARVPLPVAPAPAAPVPEAPPVPRAGVLVLDADGKPAEGAAVDLLPAHGHAVAEPDPIPLGASDAAGRIPWPARDLPFPGLVRALHPERGGGEVAVATAADCTLRLQRPLTIRGVVIAADGSPVPGASVEARFEPALRALGPVIGTSGTWIARTTSGEDGAFAFRGLPPPSGALLTARKEGWLDVQASWHPWEAAGQRIVMHRPFRAVVRVRGPDGEPVDGAAVVVSGAGRLRWKEGSVGREIVPLPGVGSGEYAREDLPPGWYHVIAAKPGFRVTLPRFEGFHPDRGPLEIALEAAEGLDGRVTDAASGVPIPDAAVSAFPFEKGAAPGGEWTFAELAGAIGMLTAKTGPDGAFRVAVAGPGDSVVLSAGRDGYEPKSGRLSELLKRGRVEIALRPRAARTLTGRVLDADGSPVAVARIRWGDGTANVDAEGRFRIERFTDTLVTVFAPGFLHEPVRVAEEQGDLGDIPLRALRSVRGVVREEGGTPVSGLRVGPRPGGRSMAGAPGVTDDAGSVVVSLPAGESVEVVPWDRDRTGSVTVSANDPDPFVLVVSRSNLADAGSIRGRIVLSSGGAPSGYGQAMARSEDAGEDRGTLAVAFDPDGSFLLSRVPAGRWTVTGWSHPDLRGEVAGVVVAAQGIVDVTIRLEKSAPPTEKPPPRVEVEIRPLPEPGEDDAHRLKTWATSWKASKSVESQPSKDGKVRVSMREEEAFTVWVHDVEGNRAGIATVDAPSAEIPVDVYLVPAGWIVLAPDPKMLDRWVVLRDARGTPIYSGFEASLPGVAGEGHRLVVPHGSWSITLARGLARRDPRVVRVTVSPGAGTRAE